MRSTSFVLLLLTFFCALTSSPIRVAHGFCFPPEERVTVTYQNRPDLRVPLPTVNVLVGGWYSQLITQAMVGILLEVSSTLLSLFHCIDSLQLVSTLQI